MLRLTLKLCTFFDIEGIHRSNIVAVSKEMDTISNEAKPQNQNQVQVKVQGPREKKPRTQKQIEAFKRCAEKRKQNLLNLNAAKQHQENNSVNNSVNSDVEEYKSQVKEMLSELSLLRKHFDERAKVKPEKEKMHVQFADDVGMDMDVDMNTEVETQSQSRPPVRMQVKTPQSLNQRQFEYGYHDHHEQFNSNGKRSINQMNPYDDERRGLIEKIYARNVNAERQARMDALRNTNRLNDNSIQILQPQLQPNETGIGMDMEGISVGTREDPRSRIVTQAQVVANMIKSGSNTQMARKAGAIAVNGLRVASGRR